MNLSNDLLLQHLLMVKAFERVFILSILLEY